MPSLAEIKSRLATVWDTVQSCVVGIEHKAEDGIALAKEVASFVGDKTSETMAGFAKFLQEKLTGPAE